MQKCVEVNKTLRGHMNFEGRQLKKHVNFVKKRRKKKEKKTRESKIRKKHAKKAIKNLTWGHLGLHSGRGWGRFWEDFGKSWGFLACFKRSWSSKMLLEASRLDFNSMLKDF